MLECSRYIILALPCIWAAIYWLPATAAASPMTTNFRCVREDYLGIGCTNPCDSGQYASLHCQCQPCPPLPARNDPDSRGDGAFERKLRHCLVAVFNVCSVDTGVQQKKSLTSTALIDASESGKSQLGDAKVPGKQQDTTPGNTNSAITFISPLDHLVLNHNASTSSQQDKPAGIWDKWGGLILGLTVLAMAIVALALWWFFESKKLKRRRGTGPQAEPLNPDTDQLGAGGRDRTHVFNDPEAPH